VAGLSRTWPGAAPGGILGGERENEARTTAGTWSTWSKFATTLAKTKVFNSSPSPETKNRMNDGDPRDFDRTVQPLPV